MRCAKALGRVEDAQGLTQGGPPFLEKIIIRVLQHLEALVLTQEETFDLF